ncbi:Fic/DOC family protein [Nocardia camponoti]|uniref:protein adenylyltransferase n=1 Tax=Nocardia camponoti TaxID=1616106 RepID=A0A917QC70_9NOCA|nr:Fic family protein [Nocardia camponoti]GGK40182.1 cell filamentation protein Fic [Nocardia camponoti]
MITDPYLDPESRILRNLLGITDAEALRQVEADLSRAALAELGVLPLRGRYDLAHLCAFHREIFGDIYPWAGQIRTVVIAKTEPFCLPQHIDDYATEVFDGLAKQRYLRGRTRADFIVGLTHFFAEVNALHPFREGNGRTQRAFFGQLAREAGWPIDWPRLDATENTFASMSSLRGDNTALHSLFEKLCAN